MPLSCNSQHTALLSFLIVYVLRLHSSTITRRITAQLRGFFFSVKVVKVVRVVREKILTTHYSLLTTRYSLLAPPLRCSASCKSFIETSRPFSRSKCSSGLRLQYL